MKKNLFFAALAFVALASCTSDEFVGDNTSPTTSNTAGAINFILNTPTVTRAEGSEAAELLTNKFKVYAVKKVGSDYSNVFATNEYQSSNADFNYDGKAYWVWYGSNTAGTTTSNTKNWEYVGTGGNVITPAIDEQTIKYWDYGADQYEFVAYSATVKDATNAYSIDKYNKDGFTITATAAELAGLYVADKLTITTKDNAPSQPANEYNKIGDIVKFTFRSSATKVRLGIYETIPGYDVQNVKFRPNASEFTATTANAILSGSFNGTSSSERGTYNVKYNATSGVAEFENTATSASGYFDFGVFTSTDKINEASINPTWANNGSYEYLSVLPNTDHYGNMILYVDYDLYNTVSHETIHVKGAKAVVPAIYMKWNPNYAYTYLFKISDNTNGTTGTEGGQNPSPQGLYPITFDALTIAGTSDAVGTITTVSTPAITTYQEGSVVDKEETGTPAVSEHGITYAASGKPIYITVNTDGTLANLESSIKLYKLASADADATEAELLLAPSKLTGKEVTSGEDQLSVLSSAESLQGIAFAANTTAKFSPAAGQTYAVEFSKAAVAATYVTVDTESFEDGVTSVKGYYTKNGDDYEACGENDKFATGTTYYSLTPASDAVKVYKVIKVAPANSGQGG